MIIAALAPPSNTPKPYQRVQIILLTSGELLLCSALYKLKKKKSANKRGGKLIEKTSNNAMICTHSKNKYLETILVSAKPLYLIVNPLFALTHLIYAP